MLVSLVAVLALVAGGLFAWDALRGDDDAAKPSKQPVVISSDDATAGVDAAAKAAETILTRSYQDYDKQVDDGDGADDRRVREGVPADRRRRRGRSSSRPRPTSRPGWSAQGVVHATRTEVQALLFLNQYVSKDGGDTDLHAVPRPGDRGAHRPRLAGLGARHQVAAASVQN